MFNRPYRFVSLGSDTTIVKKEQNPVNRFLYKFYAKKRKYLVTLELFPFNVAAIKYCDLRDKDNKEVAYKKIFNDRDAFRVITTCLFIMLDFWSKNPSISFAFYAVPREINSVAEKKAFNTAKQKQLFLEEYKAVRFKIYEYAMLNLFSPQDFIQMKDSKNSIYLLVNRNLKNATSIVIQVAKYLLENNDVILETDE